MSPLIFLLMANKRAASEAVFVFQSAEEWQADPRGVIWQGTKRGVVYQSVQRPVKWEDII